MIFITLGSQKFQFNRLLKEIDRLIEDGVITEDVFAQIGYSDYKPINYNYKEFLDRDEFSNIMSTSQKIITHGGTGAIIGALKQEKKIIAVPRLKKYDEHVDNHQCEITKTFEKMNLVLTIEDIGNLKTALKQIDSIIFKKYKSNTSNIINSIEQFIKSN